MKQYKVVGLSAAGALTIASALSKVLQEESPRGWRPMPPPGMSFTQVGGSFSWDALLVLERDIPDGLSTPVPDEEGATRLAGELLNKLVHLPPSARLRALGALTWAYCMDCGNSSPDGVSCQCQNDE